MKIYLERMIFLKTIISRRGLVRLVSFFAFALAVLTISNVMYMNRIDTLENAVQAGYSSAVEGLAQSADQISAVLTKGQYASSPSMMTRLSNELMQCSGEAKSALESLPVWGMDVSNLEKFLSQVGNYAVSLSRKAASGDELSQEERDNVKALTDCASKLSESLWELRGKMLTSDSSIAELFENVNGETEGFLTDGFSGIENGLKEMPKLIYDGPFSDHILEKMPEMTQNADEITEAEALDKAARALDTESYRVLRCDAGEEGKMPSYCFFCEGARCAVSKNGGYVVYAMKSRNVTDPKISCEQAIEYADSYLESLGIENMENTYYECYNGVCTINYAYQDGDITCYTDLIKVAVALDNGEILGYDARGYLVNHRERDFGDPVFTEDAVLKNVSASLNAESVSLAVIPTDSVEEKLCYELKCRTESGRDVLVYVNAMTGEEEEILLLVTSENGILTV